MFTLDLPSWVLYICILSSSSFAIVFYSMLVVMIKTFFLYCVVGWLQSGEFIIESIASGVVNLSSSNQLKPSFFLEGGNSISYVILVESLNVV